MGETALTNKQASANSLDQFVTLARPLTNGSEVMEVVKQALDAPGVLTFTELVELPSVQLVLQNYLILQDRIFFHSLYLFSVG